MADDLDDLDALLAELDAPTKVETPTEEVVVENDTPAVLDDLLIGEEKVEEPAPVKKRGRPKKEKVEEPVTEKEIVPEDAVKESVEEVISEVVAEIATVVEESIVNDVPRNSSGLPLVPEGVSTEVSEPQDIYILNDAQIINGNTYRRGQKITFTVGDKFYHSQTDRNGVNWLDFVRDPEAQYAYFGKILVEADQWSGIPLGSVEGITHPGIALAVSKYAQEEYKRNGKPFA